MSGSPLFKVYDYDGEYIASCKYAVDAAALAGMCDGRQVRASHAKKDTLFIEGGEHILAAESWDQAGALIDLRLTMLHTRYQAARAANPDPS